MEKDFIIYEKYSETALDYKFNSVNNQRIGTRDIKAAFISKSVAHIHQNKKFSNFRAWLHAALQPIIAYRLDSISMNNFLKVPEEIKLKLEWVYGIRC
jgi:hypothetical protein